MPLAPKPFRSASPRHNRNAWRTNPVDPKALFIWETGNCRLVIGRALARTVIVLVTGGSAASTAHYWVLPLCKWLGLP